jgi:hypothetical protein
MAAYVGLVGGITLKALVVLAHMREIVSMPVTVYVCRSDACGDRMRRRLPTVEIGRGSVVGGLVRLGGTDGVSVIVALKAGDAERGSRVREGR